MKTKPIKANTKPIQTQYKPNSRNVQIDVNLVKTRNYNNEQRTMNYELLFKTNPIKPNFKRVTYAAQIFLNVSPHFLNIFERFRIFLNVFRTFLNVFVLLILPNYRSLTPPPSFLPQKSTSHPLCADFFIFFPRFSSVFRRLSSAFCFFLVCKQFVQ